MTIKKTLSESTEQLEQKVKELTPYYTNLEPWKRGLILIALTIFLILVIYYLTKEDKDKVAQRKARAETLMEEKMLKRLEFFKKLKE